MRKSNKPQVRSLEIKRRFEPSHGAVECLAHAYERLVPILRRPVPLQRPCISLPPPQNEQQKERRRS